LGKGYMIVECGAVCPKHGLICKLKVRHWWSTGERTRHGKKHIAHQCKSMVATHYWREGEHR